MKYVLSLLAAAVVLPALSLFAGNLVDGGAGTAEAQDPNITIRKQTLPSTNEIFIFDVSGPGSECDVTLGVSRDDSDGLECDPGVYFITERSSPGWALTNVVCSVSGGATAQIDIAARRVRVDVSSGTVDCTFVNSRTDPVPARIDILGASQVGIQSVSQYEVNIFGITGAPVSDNIPVHVSTNFGQVTPVDSLTFGGGIFFNYIAPPVSGTAILTVTAGNVTAQKAVQVGAGGPTPGFPGGCTPLTQQLCVQVACGTGPGGTATVTFVWQSFNGEVLQFLDLSLFNNGFAPGTFLGAGPLSPNTTSFTWTGILPGLTHFWRVNHLFASGAWIPTVTGFFTPC